MKVITPLLEKYFNTNLTLEEYKDIFLKLGYEIESIKNINNTSDVVMAKVISCEKHPNADKLSFCKVLLNESEIDVVCGGNNVKSDQWVIYAPVNSKVKGITLKQKDLRGIVSNGMILSLSELINIETSNLPQEEKGNILEISKSFAENKTLENFYDQNLMEGYIFDLTILPDREYAKNYMNLAKEIAAFKGLEYSNFFSTIKKSTLQPSLEKDNINLLDNVNVFSSIEVNSKFSKIDTPLFIKNALLMSDILVKNTFEDILQFVFLITGVSVYATEKIIKLTQNENILKINDENELDLLTAGLNNLNKQNLNEREISLFATSFSCDKNPFDVKNIESKHGINHIRIEKNGDEISTAIKLATKLLLKYSYIDYNSDYLLKVNKTPLKPNIKIKLSEIRKIIGYDVDFSKPLDILEALDFEFIASEDNYLTIEPPKYRKDINTVQDIIEEIVRTIGTENIVPSSNLVFSNEIKRSVWGTNVDKIKSFMDKFKFNEVKTYQLITEEDAKKYDFFNDQKFLKLKDDYSNKLNIYRTNLFISLLETYVYNYRKNQNLETIPLFEISNVFIKNILDETRIRGNVTLGIMIDNHFDPNIKNPAQILKIFATKILKLLNKKDIELNFKDIDFDFIFTSKNSLKIYYKDIYVGVVGEVHPSILMEQKLIRLDKIQRKLFYLEIRLKDIFIE